MQQLEQQQALAQSRNDVNKALVQGSRAARGSLADRLMKLEQCRSVGILQCFTDSLQVGE